MSVIRINKTKDYTIMCNYHLKDKNLSLKAVGLMSKILSLPNDWNYSVEGLVAICKESTDTIKSTLNELKENGYLKVTKLMPNQTKTGRIEYIYDIFEKPKNQKEKDEKIKKQEGEKQPLVFQEVEFQEVENPLQYNTNNKILKNKELNIYKGQYKKAEEVLPFWFNKNFESNIVTEETQKDFEKKLQELRNE